MEIRDGYKQTEVGVIPSDWEVSPLEAFTSFISYGFTNPMPTSESGVHMITAKDINSGKIQFDTARCTTEEAYRTLLTAKSRPKKGDLLLTKDGTLGRLALVGDRTVCVNQSVAVLRPNTKAIPEFLKVLLEAPAYQNRMLEDAGGSTIKHIYITIVNRMPLVVPSTKAEQTAIASVLSDADALIQSLTTLIAKKRNIKQGAVQELLIGKRRLPGFEEKKGYKKTEVGVVPSDWEVKELCDIFDISSGNGSLIKTAENGKYFIIEMGSISENGELLLNKQSNTRQNLLIEGDLVMPTRDIGKGKIIGKVAYLDKNDAYILSNNVYRITLKNDLYDANFFYFLINSQSINKNLKRKVAKSVQLALNKKYVEKQQVYFPFSKLEQTRIATILADMNAEISAIETKLAKYKQVKQGMMQNLLTGKIRLV